MTLDPAVCSKARLARDARFDGRFFIGVRTTGIYCRPVCPARSPKEENVRYYPTAAAASAAGLRPCLRCRPEASPGTPAWNGCTTTVSRALRLIAEGALDEGSVSELSTRLGIGPRHLHRLFLEHLGAPPVAIAQTRRLQFAKRLIDQTTRPFTEVALASGFGSIRRFNAVVERAYHRSPTHLRILAQRAGITQSGAYRFELPYREPFDFPALVEFLGPRAIAGIEQVDAVRYRRAFSLARQAGSFTVMPGRAGLAVEVEYPDPRALLQILERVRRMFDLAADPHTIAAAFGRDATLGPRIRRRPGLRLPGAWDPFELSIRAILGQQVSVKGASTLCGRLVARLGDGGFPRAETLAEADIGSIVGLPRKRAEAIRAFSQGVAAGEIDLSAGADAAVFRERLRAIPGLGDWTAQYISMRAFNDPDAFPASDLGLLKASGAQSPRELLEMAEAWRPWRAYAAMYLWQVQA